MQRSRLKPSLFCKPVYCFFFCYFYIRVIPLKLSATVGLASATIRSTGNVDVGPLSGTWGTFVAGIRPITTSLGRSSRDKRRAACRTAVRAIRSTVSVGWVIDCFCANQARVGCIEPILACLEWVHKWNTAFVFTVATIALALYISIRNLHCVLFDKKKKERGKVLLLGFVKHRRKINIKGRKTSTYIIVLIKGNKSQSHISKRTSHISKHTMLH